MIAARSAAGGGGGRGREGKEERKRKGGKKKDILCTNEKKSGLFVRNSSSPKYFWWDFLRFRKIVVENSSVRSLGNQVCDSQDQCSCHLQVIKVTPHIKRSMFPITFPADFTLVLSTWNSSVLLIYCWSIFGRSK